MSGIPNVSSIYRDLSHISCNFNPPHNQYSLEPSKLTTTNSFQDLYAYKEKRHQQLMNKLQNSANEYHMIIGNNPPSGSSSYQASNNYNQTAQYNIKSAYSPAYLFNFAAQNSGEGPYNGLANRSAEIRSNNFVMPKIRYRHIQDQEQKSKANAYKQTQPMEAFDEKMELQREFYEDGPTNSNSKKRITQSMKVQTKLEPEDDNLSEISQTNSNLRQARSTRNNKQYEEKIESYYELCRKKLNTRGGNQKDPEAETKYTRAPSSKARPMKLDEAIKLLSID